LADTLEKRKTKQTKPNQTKTQGRKKKKNVVCLFVCLFVCPLDQTHVFKKSL
jgi:hypothetical protein